MTFEQESTPYSTDGRESTGQDISDIRGDLTSRAGVPESGQNDWPDGRVAPSTRALHSRPDRI